MTNFILRAAVSFVLMSFSALGSASHEEVEELTIDTAFQQVNKALYTIEETRTYCNTNFPRQVKRNDEAYDSWELQYSYFLKEFDTNYANWKRGFDKNIQLQFSSLESINREQVGNKIANEFKDGAVDKCYTYKPSLFRPRSNIELSQQEAVNFIRNEALNSFIKAREASGANPYCTWQQSLAASIAQSRDEGIDIKAQKAKLKQLKKEPSEIDKKTRRKQLKDHSDMISELYSNEALKANTFALLKFTQCQRADEGLESNKLKKSLDGILQCQNTLIDNLDDFGNCINKSLVK